MAQLYFQRKSATFYVANPDGSSDERLGQPIYIVETREQWVAMDPIYCWRAVAPDNTILGEQLERLEALRRCEADVPLYEAGETPD